MVSLAAVLGVAACGAGQIAQSAGQRPAAEGANGQIGSIYLRDVTFEVPEKYSWPAGSTVALEGVIVNEGISEDRLVSVSWQGQQAQLVEVGDAVAGTSDASGSSGTTSSGEAAGSSGSSEATAADSSGEVAETSEGDDPSPSGSASESASGSESASESSSASVSASSSESAAPSQPLDLPAQSLVRFPTTATVTFTSIPEEIFSSQLIRLTFVFEKAGTKVVDVPVGVPMDERSQGSAYNYGEEEGGEGGGEGGGGE